MVEERSPLQFLGRVLGTINSWNGDPGSIWDVFNFVPAPGVSLPACDTLTIDEEGGNLIIRNDAAETERVFDIITILKDIPKSI